MALSPGAWLGPYQIRGSLGAGGMGEVYRAHDPRLGRDVALKILPEAMARDAERLERFTREARTVAALNHPHIVTIFSTEEAGGIRFMTMELIEGRTLDQMIPTSGVSMAQFFDVATALADALAAAHQQHVTHRDLKPANVMVTDSGRVKILDFGLSRAGEHEAQGPAHLEEEATRQKLTQAGTILGTMPYMSPEQIEARPLDGRSDIFSLGIVMHEMATGTRPFRGETSPALMSSILKDHPKSVVELRADAPEGVAQIIARCLEKSPRDRIQSAHEVLIELRAQRRAWESGASLAHSRSAQAAAAPVRGSDLRIAVLPFSPRPATGDSEALADGLTEDIAAGLARFPNLRVASRSEIDRVKGLAPDAATASQLNARYFVEGTVRSAGTSLRVSARLVDASTGTHIWSETYERSLAEGVFALQDDVASRVIASVADSNGALVRSMGAALRDRAWQELSTLELLIRFETYAQRFQPAEHAILRDAFEAAVARAPNDAQAWACLSALVTHEHAFDLNSRPESLRRAREAAQRALDVDSTCHRAWLFLGFSSFVARDLSGVRAAAERVIQINPLDTAKLAATAMMLTGAGDVERGCALARQATSLHSNVAGWYRFPFFSQRYIAREYPEALEEAKRSSIETFRLGHMATAAAAGQAGSAIDASAALDALARLDGQPLSSARERAIWSRWFWDEALVQNLVLGFEKAVALVAAAPGEAGPQSEPAAASSERPSSRISGPAASIAVLPFTDLSAEKDQEWFCDGVAEEILTTLSQLKGLSVAARASAFSFRGRGDDLGAIGDKLHVTTVLDGSVRRSGDRLRITVRLSDVANGYQIWSDRYDRDLKDVFDVQDEIARTIAERLRLGIAGGAAPRVVRHTENQEAYHLYLRGRHLWYARAKGSLLRARQLFEEATQKDPEYVLPYVGLADLFAIQSLYGFETGEIAEPRARAALKRALAINDQVADAHRALGFARLFFDWDLKAAVRAFERSSELDPASGLTHIWLGWPTWIGRDEAAIAAARRAQALDPLNAYIHSLAGAVLDFYGRSAEGVSEFEKALELDPNYLVPLYIGGGIYSRLGRHDDALRLFGRAVELSERAPFYVSYDAWARARAGRTDEARTALAELEGRAASEYVQPLHLAIVHSALGELDRAFELLGEGVRLRNAWIASPRMPMFENFRCDTRFAEHLRRIGHPDVPPAG